MNNQGKFVIILDILQILVSLLAMIASIFILMGNNKDYIAISLVGVAFISTILFFSGIGNFKIDYNILKKIV